MAGLYSVPTQNAVQKQLDSTLSAGATSLTLNEDVSGLFSGVSATRPGVLVIDRVDANGNVKTDGSREYITFTGVSSATLTGLTRNADTSSSDQEHAVGAIVEFLPDVLWATAIATWAAVSHDVSTGGHAADAIDDITEIASALKSGSDATLITGTAGTNTYTPKWNADGDLVDGYAFLDEDDMASNSATAVASQQSIKAYVDSNPAIWIDAGETWTYASADDPTYTFTVAGVDLTTKYYPGMRIKLTQSTGGTKYFIITKVAFSTDTTVTIYGGTDYDLNNEAISSPYYSVVKAPGGFPLDPLKWTVTTVNTSNNSQASPTASQWYNLGSITISIPIGSWEVSYKAHGGATVGTSSLVPSYTTLSTANNSASDADFTQKFSATGTEVAGARFMKKHLLLTSKTPYYLNFMTDASGMSNLINYGGQSKTVISAVCAYL